ncbi:MAG: hypothetical protein HY547_07980 [Elusimicrobia bacterium]|nr:hypothetical protein [Elusimicrobiota bacterium]
MKQFQGLIKRLGPRRRFWLLAIGAPLAILALGASADIVALWRNQRKIRKLSSAIENRQQLHEAMTRQLELLKRQDPGAWLQAFREQTHALLPTEVEYRFQEH